MLFKLDLALSELAYIVRKNIKELLHQYDENLQELQIVLQVRKNNFLSA